MFVAVDGIDGAGKTTLVFQLAQCLAEADPLVTKEPTNHTPWGRRLRESARRGRLPKDKEIEFFHKDRLWHLANVIEPALAAGRMVISDRYVDSTLAFQTVSREEADALYESFLADIRVPDITFILECSVEVGLERIYESRGRLTKFEDFETLENARNIYESRSGEKYCALDACGTIQETLQQAMIAFGERFSYSLSLEECYSDLGIQLPYAQSTLKSAAGS